MRRQVVRPDILQGTAVTSERSPQPIDDHGSAGRIGS
jgi:hypothetical protein